MYLIDTNILSELRKKKSGKADTNVVAWASRIPAGHLFLSAITILELETGVLQMERRDAEQGRRLRQWLEEQVLQVFADRILAMDTAVARRCAALHVPNRCAERDAIIAATALVHRMTVVTRNTTDFAACGASLLNPWEMAGN